MSRVKSDSMEIRSKVYSVNACGRCTSPRQVASSAHRITVTQKGLLRVLTPCGLSSDPTPEHRFSDLFPHAFPILLNNLTRDALYGKSEIWNGKRVLAPGRRFRLDKFEWQILGRRRNGERDEDNDERPSCLRPIDHSAGRTVYAPPPARTSSHYHLFREKRPGKIVTLRVIRSLLQLHAKPPLSLTPTVRLVLLIPPTRIYARIPEVR